MRKTVYISFLVVFLVPTILLGASPSELERQIEQVRLERETLVEEQKKLQAELEAINREGQTIGAAVKSLDATKKKLNTDINVTQSKITSTNLIIQTLENTMSEKEKQISVHKKAITNTLLTLSEYDSRPLILNLLASTGLSNIWRDRSQLEGLSGRLEE